MDVRLVPSGSYVKTMEEYSKKVMRGYITWLEEFSAGNSRWKMGIAPGIEEGEHDNLYMYLAVADRDRLPRGWYREAYFRLTLCNQAGYDWPSFDMRKVFDGESVMHGRDLISLSDLHGQSGHLRKDTIKVQATVVVCRAFPMAADETCVGTNNLKNSMLSNFKNSLLGLRRFLEAVEPSLLKEGMTPSKEEVRDAKQSLKECISGFCKTNFHDKMAVAISTLSLAKHGMSAEQQDCVRKFKEDFNNLLTDYMYFETVNSAYELHELHREGIVSKLKWFHQKQICCKEDMDKVAREREKLKERMKEVGSEGDDKLKQQFKQVEDDKIKLIALAEDLAARAREVMFKYNANEKRAAELLERKGVVEERMCRSNLAWSSLKLNFG